MRLLLIELYLWILLLPIGLIGIGAGSNQAVLIANYDKFPVMANTVHITIFGGVLEKVDDVEMLDGVHCIMTPKTHLNFLADIFDFGGAVYSVGDGLLSLGFWLWEFAPIVWGTLIVRKILVGEATI